jgi:hypothetical protein
MKKKYKVLIWILAIIIVILAIDLFLWIKDNRQNDIDYNNPTRITSDGQYAYIDSLSKINSFCGDILVYENNERKNKIVALSICENNITEFEHKDNVLVIRGGNCGLYKINTKTGKGDLYGVDFFSGEEFKTNNPCAIQDDGFGGVGTFNINSYKSKWNPPTATMYSIFDYLRNRQFKREQENN